MLNFSKTIAMISALTAAIFVTSAGTNAQQAGPPKGPELRLPGMPPLQLPPGTQVFGPSSKAKPPASSSGSGQERGPDLRKRQAKQKNPKPATKPADRKAVLDELFNRLGKAKNRRQARGIVRSIERAWMNSGSDTADLLMTRAALAMKKKNHRLALQLLDKIVYLEPGWSEVWNKRATVRYFSDDPDGAVSDIAETLAREPRHFGALVGLGFILRRAKLEKLSLKVFRRALEINPQLKNISSIIDKLKVSVEGQGI